MKKFFLIFTLLLASQAMLLSQSETLVNKTWEHFFGAPNDYEWAASILDNAGNLITTGHTTLDATNTELLLIKQEPDGDVLWQQAFQVSQNTKNGGVALAVDASDNIYVAGVTSTSGNLNDFDFLVLKYSSGGTKIWHQTFNGTGSGTDVPTGIIANSTRVYVCGTSKGSTTSMDYWALRLTASNGSLEWQKRYDYAGLDDIPANMAVDASGNVVLTGSSAASALNWEVATVKYGFSNGSLLNENRVPNDGNLGLTKPSAITKDASGNFIISGIKTTNGTHFDIRTIKLTSSLGITWVQDYDSGSKVDSVSAIVCDASGGITLTGWSSTQEGGSDFLTLKYKGDGNLGWAKKRTVNPQDVLSKGRALAIDANGNIIVAGDLKGGMVVTSYGTSGEVVWEKEIKDADIQSNRPLGLLLNQEDEIFITSLARNQSGKSLLNYKLNTLVRPQNHVLDQFGIPTHLQNEVIVRFKPDILKSTFIDNTDLRFGSLNEILKDTSCLRTIVEVLSDNNIGDWAAVKIHRNMTTADSVATTRLGKSIKVPDFYNTLVLLSDSRSLAETDISELLEDDKLKCCIRYAEINQVVTLDDCEPNDPIYVNQGNLHPTGDYPNGDINIEPAWCIAGAGCSGVRVSIIDTGVRWSHEDYGDGSFAGSVIVDGKDYGTGEHISTNNDNDLDSHGTSVASVIGSIRNNGIGVAGIAGGSGSADGVRLIAQKAFVGGVDNIIEAFGDAVDIYAADVINCSGGFTPSDPPSGNDLALREKLHHANRMGVIVCASRGNSDADPNTVNNQPRYPGTAQDEWVLCVGGTGTDGNYNPQCRFGEPIDIAAPSRWQLTRTAQACIPGTGGTGIPCTQSDQAYGGISFTSGATPHVSGLAALLICYASSQGTELVQEDIEYIIQASATDVGATGYDEQTGHGRINAGAALQMIEGPNCHVYHFGTDANINAKSNELIETGVPLELTEPYTTEGGQTFDAGMYTADVYKVTASVSNPLPANTTITHHWERHSSSTVFRHYETVGGQNFLQPVENVLITGTSGVSTPLEGYVYYLKNGDCSIEGWIPASPDDAQLTYSLIGCASTAASEVVAGVIRVFPNPASTQLTIVMPEYEEIEDCQLSILDFSGRQVMLHKVKTGGDLNIGIAQLPEGVYTCLLQTDGKYFSSKFVKL